MIARIVRCVVCTLLFLGGTVTGIVLSKYDKVRLDPAVTFGNIFQAGVTIVSACVVTVYLQKMTGDRRKQKEILLDQLKDLQELLKELDGFRASEQSALAKIVATLKKLRMKNDLLQSCMKEARVDPAIIKLSDLSDSIPKLRSLFTSTPKKTLEDFAETENCPAYVKDGLIKYSIETVNEIDSAIAEYKQAIFKAQLRLNLS